MEQDSQVSYDSTKEFANWCLKDTKNPGVKNLAELPYIHTILKSQTWAPNSGISDLHAEYLFDYLVPEYQQGRNDPKSTTLIWQAFWNHYLKFQNRGLETDIHVPFCPWSIDELQNIRLQEHREAIFIPPFFSRAGNFGWLPRMFNEPLTYLKMHRYHITNPNERVGWLLIDQDEDSPHRYYRVREIVDEFKREHAQPSTLNEYLIGSQFHRLVYGKRFDQGETWTCMLGTNFNTSDSGPSTALFCIKYNPEGEIDIKEDNSVYDLTDTKQDVYIGFRSVKQTPKSS